MKKLCTNSQFGILPLLLGIFLLGATSRGLSSPCFSNVHASLGAISIVLSESASPNALSLFKAKRIKAPQTAFADTPLFILDTRPPLLALHTASENGVIEKQPNIDFYEKGTTVTLTAAPNAGYKFTGWIGDVSPEQQQANPLTILIDAEKTITATFAVTMDRPAQWLLW